MDNEQYEIKSFNDFIGFVEQIRSSGKEIWFRGQRDSSWDVTPGLYRKAVMDLRPNTGGISMLRYKFPKFLEKFNEFKIETQKVQNIPDELNDIQYLFLAQHHKLQTPLLDWSTDPLVALFFALDGFEKKEEEEIYPCLYAIKPCLINQSSHFRITGNNGVTHDINEPICIDDRLLDKYVEEITSDDSPFNVYPLAVYSNEDFSHRISRQSGKFTIHGPITELRSNPWYTTSINGVAFGEVAKINESAIPELKKILDILDVNKNSIYRKGDNPLDKICSVLEECHQ